MVAGLHVKSSQIIYAAIFIHRAQTIMSLSQANVMIASKKPDV